MGKAARGFQDNVAEFAPTFIAGRMRGFEKDMRICLTPRPRNDGKPGSTHAYFPGLAHCCSTLEYLAAMHSGHRIDRIGRLQIVAYANRFLPPAYDAEAVRILYDYFRNTVNHRGIASGVWLDRSEVGRGRRLTWKINAAVIRPPIAIRAKPGQIRHLSPWPCRYTHRVHINLGRLWRDIAASALVFAATIREDAGLQANFQTCMRQLYPRD